MVKKIMSEWELKDDQLDEINIMMRHYWDVD